MMKYPGFLRLCAAILTAAALLAPGWAAAASSEPPAAVNPSLSLPQFGSYSGKIQEIQYDDAGRESSLVVEDAEGGLFVFTLSEKTYRHAASGAALSVGTPVTAWYDATRPMTLQYPPKAEAEAVAIGDLPSGQSIKVDRFGGDLVSSDGALKITAGDDTDIADATGAPYGGALQDHDLLVVYGPSTRSIPAQTTPEFVVVLDAGRSETQPEEPPRPQGDPRVTTARVHMRAGEGVGYVSLGVLPRGETVYVTRYTGKWAEAVVGGKLVYIYAGYLR